MKVTRVLLFRMLGITEDGAAEKAGAARAIVASALTLGLVGDFLLRASPWGLNAAIWFGSVCAVAIALPRFSALNLHRRADVWLWGALGLSIMLAWRSSPVLQTMNAIAILVCMGMVAFRTTASAVRMAGSTAYAGNLVVSGVQAVIGMAVTLTRVLDWRTVGAGRFTHVAALVRGLAIAAVPVLVFGALFASADVFFRDALRTALFFSFRDALSHLALVVLLTWLVGSYLWGALLAEREPLPAPAPIGVLRFEFIETGVVFGLVNAVFLLFVGVQFRYLFGGGDRVEASSSLTYAEYARRGFFELVAVAALVVPFILLTHWLLPRSYARLQRFYGALAAVLVLLVFVVMASALQRMRLYQETFGLTELRLYTTAFMFWLVAALAWLSWTVLRGRRDRFAFGVLTAGLVLVVVLNGLNPDAFIVRRNAAIADVRSFDSDYALGLGPDAVPTLVANFDKVLPGDRCTVARELRRRYLDVDADWRSWSWSRDQASQAVESSDALAVACAAE